MANDNSQNNQSVSKIVYLNGAQSNTSSLGGCCFGVIPYATDLALYTNPKEYDVVIIQNGTNGGVDIAIYINNTWVVKALRGSQGLAGIKGDKGDKGDTGSSGTNGVNGSQGEAGRTPKHRWNSTQLQFELPDGTWGTLIDLKGEQGVNGTNGINGLKGDKPNHEWNNTQVRFQLPNGSWGTYTDLKGEQGLQGLKGDKPNHEFVDTSLRFQLPDGSWGVTVDLKGDKGDKGDTGAVGLVPEHETDGKRVRFRNPDNTWGAWITLSGNNLDGVLPKCLTEDTLAWQGFSDAQKVQAIIDKICLEEPSNLTLLSSKPDSAGAGTVDLLYGQPQEVISIRFSLFASDVDSGITFSNPVNVTLPNTVGVDIVPLILSSTGTLQIGYQVQDITKTTYCLVTLESRSSGEDFPKRASTVIKFDA